MDKDARKRDGFWKAEATGVTDRVRKLNAKRDKQRQVCFLLIACGVCDFCLLA